MSDIWMGISPEPSATRVIVMAGPSETILKARLLPRQGHPRAMATLLEAVALWQGERVRAVLSVADWDGGSGSAFSRDAFMDFGGPLYTLDWVPRAVGARTATWPASVSSVTCVSRCSSR